MPVATWGARVVLFLRDDRVWSRGLAWLVLVLASAQVLLSAAMLTLGSEAWGFALVGGICSASVVVPLLVTETTVFSLWGPVALVVTLGTGVRGLAIATGFPSPEAVQDKFTLGRSFSDLVWPSTVTVLSVGGVMVGYILARRCRVPPPRRKTRRVRTPDAEILTARRAVVVIGGFAVVGTVATILYLRSVGGLGVPINERRTVYEAGGEFQSYGHWEFLARSGVVALLIYLAWILLRRDRLRVRDWALLVLLAANAFAINVITTTRTDVLYVTLGMLMLVRLVRGRVSLPSSLASALLVLVAIGMLSDLREGPTSTPPSPPAVEGSEKPTSPDGAEGPKIPLALDVGVSSGLSSGLLNRNGYDLSKTLVVVDSVPDDLPYAYGSTMARYVLAPVPRAVWPDKPAISEGVTIGRKVYGLERTGIPPGLTGELVWNFGRTLAVMLSFVIGIALGVVERTAFGWPRISITALVLQALVVLPLGKAVMGVSLGQGLSSTAQTLVLLSPLLLLSLTWSRASPEPNAVPHD